ncbi:hypothetical protein TcasGA2_TC002048 [Tribolium castaneum]|uniref:Transposable element P transposase-like RNase H domain-containing protein n=1 Tax=Tribolium castaneum TaxID=7070 RepID=D7ELN4_TRICA|nr:hypothetical protein TcasGA2_TC002048 [Tribolium castaneum]
MDVVPRKKYCCKICEDHFDESALVNERKNRLNFGAVPLVPTEPSDIHLLVDLPHLDQQSKIDEDPSSSDLSEENVNVVGSLSVESPSTSSFVNLAYDELCSSSHSQNLTPRKELMYKAHRNIQSKLCRLSKTLEKEKVKAILAKIQFDNPGILERMKNQVSKMKRANSYCSLLFDEMSVCQGFHYERAKQYISVYEDMGSLGRTNKAANYALVFMI